DRRSAAHRPSVPRVERMALLLDLQRQGEQERHHRRTDHDVGEHERLHDPVDGGLLRAAVREERRDRAGAVPDPDEEHVARRLRHREAEDEVHEVAARDDAVHADEQEPCRHRVEESAHRDPRLARARRTTSVWWRNSWNKATSAPVTARPTVTSPKRMVPPEASVPDWPSGSTFCRNAAPPMRPNVPMTA